MAGDEQASHPDPRERTVKTAGQIVKYSREIYHLESVEEVANLTLEATPRFVDGRPSSMVAEVRNGELRVLASMLPEATTGDPGELARRAYETDRVVVCAGADTDVAYTSEETAVVDPAECGKSEVGGAWVAAPTVYREGVDESGAVLVLHWPSLARIEEYHVRPVDYLAEHVATAIVNIRSRERLERARNDLAKRKEMVEVYDRLLRHDLGNDLQVIAGFSEAMVTEVDGDENEQLGEYATKISQTAQSAADLIDTVGETVRTLESEGEPEVRDLEPILTDVVADVRTKFDSLTVAYDPGAFEYEVYTGDLIDSVFTNVLSNAAVHNEGAVTVRLSAEEPTPDTVLVRIADDGAGIPAAVRDEIFQMGQKGPDSEGTGFGLGLVRTLVESYGGAVEVRDSEFDGAEFRITLDRP